MTGISRPLPRLYGMIAWSLLVGTADSCQLAWLNQFDLSELVLLTQLRSSKASTELDVDPEIKRAIIAT
ncbi:MAG: hypothetical protein IT449_03660 [Phycisphaerales bacterium]|nr:hypothetical protein [Phycisphaerales bacterium]